MNLMRITSLLLIVLGLVIVSWTYVVIKSGEPSSSTLADAWDRHCVLVGVTCGYYEKSQFGRVAQSADYLVETYWEASFLLGAVMFGVGVWQYRRR